MRPLRFSLQRRILVPVAILVAIAVAQILWPGKSSGQGQGNKMLGTVSPGDGTAAVYPSNFGANFLGTQETCSIVALGYFQGGSGYYETGEIIPSGCEGYGETSPPGYFVERVEPVAINGDTQVDFQVYSQFAWLSGTIKNAVTGQTIPTTASITAYGNCGNTKGAIGSTFDFGGTPGEPYYGGGLTLCRPGTSGPGQDTFRMVAVAGSDYFSETAYNTLSSGQEQSGYQIALYPSQGNIQGTIRDAFTGALVSTCTRASNPTSSPIAPAGPSPSPLPLSLPIGAST